MRTEAQIADALRALAPAEDAAPTSALGVFETNRELFFEAGVAGVPADAESWMHDLVDQIRVLRQAVNEPYQVDDVGDRAVRLTLRSGLSSIELPREARDRLISCLESLRGRVVGREGARDYSGVEASEGEALFKIGDPAIVARAVERLEARAAERPIVFRLDVDDLQALHAQPAHVTHELSRCAKQVLEAPLRVFAGIRREGALRAGFAFVGRPKRAYGNDGAATEPPSGLLYVVYADANRYVFDWDWVEEDESRAGYPIDSKARFGDERKGGLPPAALEGTDGLTAGKLDPQRAWHSRRGDCIFCYIDDAPGYARRINDDLTVFYARASRGQVVGCKLKNAERLVESLASANSSIKEVLLFAPQLRVTAVLAQSLARQTEAAREYVRLLGDLEKFDPRVEGPADLEEYDSLGSTEQSPLSEPVPVQELS